MKKVSKYIRVQNITSNSCKVRKADYWDSGSDRFVLQLTTMENYRVGSKLWPTYSAENGRYGTGTSKGNWKC